MCVPTEYAIKQGTLTNSSYQVGGKATCYWWLRSPGIDQRHVFYVFTGGSRLSLGIDHSDSAVRPALWVDLGSGVF